jgi:hypothetical protein
MKFGTDMVLGAGTYKAMQLPIFLQLSQYRTHLSNMHQGSQLSRNYGDAGVSFLQNKKASTARL